MNNNYRIRLKKPTYVYKREKEFLQRKILSEQYL